MLFIRTTVVIYWLIVIDILGSPLLQGIAIYMNDN